MRFSQAFEPLNTHQHAVKSFDCGKTEMNQFLKKFASKHAKQGISKTMVLTSLEPDVARQTVVAYYTLSITTVYRKSFPTQSLPRYPIPVTLLARLAIDTRFQKQKLGTKTLIYALRHAAQLNELGLTTYGLVLDVLDEEALAFYNTFHFFLPLSDDPMRLFLSMHELKKI